MSFCSREKKSSSIPCPDAKILKVYIHREICIDSPGYRGPSDTLNARSVEPITVDIN